MLKLEVEKRDKVIDTHDNAMMVKDNEIKSMRQRVQQAMEETERSLREHEERTKRIEAEFDKKKK
jgi:hypothetical protein